MSNLYEKNFENLVRLDVDSVRTINFAKTLDDITNFLTAFSIISSVILKMKIDDKEELSEYEKGQKYMLDLIQKLIDTALNKKGEN